MYLDLRDPEQGNRYEARVPGGDPIPGVLELDTDECWLKIRTAVAQAVPDAVPDEPEISEPRRRLTNVLMAVAGLVSADIVKTHRSFDVWDKLNGCVAMPARWRGEE